MKVEFYIGLFGFTKQIGINIAEELKNKFSFLKITNYRKSNWGYKVWAELNISDLTEKNKQNLEKFLNEKTKTRRQINPKAFVVSNGFVVNLNLLKIP